MKEQTRYSRLANLTKLINTKLELREVLSHVVEAISEEIVQCDSVGIYLPQEDGTFRGYVGKPDVMNGMTLDMHVIDLEYDLLAKEVIETQKTIYIPDTSKDSRPDPRAVQGFKIKSLLVLPISYEQELFGLVFLFDYGTPMNLTESEIQSVEAYVNMAAVAIQNANNMTRKENLISEKQLLLDVTRELSMCSTMQEGIEKCFSYVSKVMNTDNIGVHILDPIAEKNIKPAKLSKHSDWSEEEWKKTHFEANLDPSDDEVFHDVVRTKEPIIIPDAFADPRPNHEACKQFGIKGMFMFPMVSLGEVLGVIAVVNLGDRIVQYPKADIQLVQSIVDATAATLSNLLYIEKQEAIIEERTSEVREKNQELELVVSELQQLSNEKELILNSAGEGIFGLDLDGYITFCNPASVAMLGYDSKEELIGKPSSIIFKRKDKHSQVKPTKKKWNKSNTDEEFFRKDGTSFPAEFNISSIQEKGTVLGEVVIFKDITERKKMEEEIKYFAYYDSLTDLPNRLLLIDRMNQAISNAKVHDQKLAVLFLDLDRFKLVNDTMGHTYGDLLLRDVAKRLTACVPENATVSRQGGDEFTILLTIKSKDDVRRVVNAITMAFTKPFTVKDNEIYIKTSIGISLFPEDGDTAESLIKNADTAMYKSKEIAGGSYHFFRSGMDTRSMESIKFENGLYKALDNNELLLFYQPQINYETNALVGAEALLRWNHPTEGLVPPDKFIPIAEETGLIVPIGEWVVRTACKQMKEWHDAGLPKVSVSVNLSVRQFIQNDLYTSIKNILQETGLSPEYLHLEITENQIIKNTELTVKTMEKFKELGIKIAIDDFGTGYSSLGYLKNLPIHTLKIDKSFIRDIMEDEDDRAITETIITLAKNLKLKVIAEGVETEEQAKFLRAKECDFMQGYYFSRPVTSASFEEKYVTRK